MDCRAVLRPDLADVRRAGPGARPGLRCLSEPGGRLFVEYRWKPRGHPGILRAVIRAGAAWGLVPDKLCRSGLSALSSQGLIAPATPHAWGTGGVFRATTELQNQHETRWSPYYAVDRNKATGVIVVNNIGHQTMVPFDV